MKCVAADTILMRFAGPISTGCTDEAAVNYDAAVTEDDGSCLYLGGRGLGTKSWSAMTTPHKLDDWYPVEEYETWGTGEYCSVPDGTTVEDLDSWGCISGDCFLHRQCGTGAFCCVTDDHEGCTTVYDTEDVDKEGWKLVFRHDISSAGGWDHGVWRYTNNTEMAKFSILDELESYRRPGDGRFEFKACWPDSSFSDCMEWIQLLNPMKNPDKTNMYATCTDCAYAPDEDPDGDAEFRGLQYNGQYSLFDGDSDGNYLQIGAESIVNGGMYGPQYKGDDGAAGYPTVVELYVRPETNGAMCVDCRACYDADGAVRMATFTSAGDANNTYSYTSSACPAYCLTEEHVSPVPRAATLRATHQLVIESEGLSERPCQVIVSYDSLEDEETNTTICEGSKTVQSDSVPETMEFGRVGGVSTRAFFVAPTAANYTFNTRFDDGGELWLSPNADPRAAELLVAVSSAGNAGSAPGTDSAASASCDKWSCAGDRCFRAFTGQLEYDSAARACASYSAVLAAPRSSAENVLIQNLISAKGLSRAWLGVSDASKEGFFNYPNGDYAGFGANSVVEDWSYENWAGTEPNDASGIENCGEMLGSGSWNDLPCTGYPIPFVCEIDDGCSGSRSTDPIAMKAGEVRYLELLGYNNDDAAMSLLTLTIDSGDANECWTTSEVLGLSAEFLREIRTDAPVAEVVIDGFTAACAEDGVCGFTYSADQTPVVESVEPATSTPGETTITFTGYGFEQNADLLDVDIGGAPCTITACNETFIECIVTEEKGTAGTFTPSVKVYNKGFASNTVQHTILMSIDTIAPTNGSLYGGMTLTLTGTGFARFGLHNQIKLLLQNDTKSSAEPRGTHGIYDDDWLWERGHLNGTASYTEVLCVPRTLKNRACRYTDEDSGNECGEYVESAYEDVRIREYAEWFDWSSPTYIECVVESLIEPLPELSIAVVNVSIVNNTALMDTIGLEKELDGAKLNFDCSELSHCMKKDA